MGSFYRSIIVISWVILFIHTNSNAQNHHLIFNQLSEEDGLLEAQEYFLSFDSDNLTWIGTDHGLMSYDGVNLERVEHLDSISDILARSKITSKCFEDHTNDLWFSNNNALCHFNRSTNEIQGFTHSDSSSNYKLVDLNKDGEVFLTFEINKRRALYSYNIGNGTFDKITNLQGSKCHLIFNNQAQLEQVIETSLPRQPGLIWQNVLTGKSKHVKFLEKTDGSKRTFSSRVSGVKSDSKGNLWVGLYNGIGLYIPGEDDGTVAFERFSLIDEDIGWVKDIEILDEEHLLIACDVGLVLFDLNKKSFTYKFDNHKDNPFSLQLLSLIHI